jgi:hypothetical protein
VAAKNKRPASPNIQADFAAHVEANRRAHEWAEKCIAYREAEKHAQAKAAELKARHWLRSVMLREARASTREAFRRAQGRGLEKIPSCLTRLRRILKLLGNSCPNPGGFVRQWPSDSACSSTAYARPGQLLLHHWRMFGNAYFLGVFHGIV